MEEQFNYVIKDDQEYAFLNPVFRKVLVKNRFEYYLKRSGIPEAYWSIEFSDYVGTNGRRNLRKVVKYADNFDKKDFNFVHLYIYGKNNTQKTTLLCNIGKQALRRGKTIQYVSAGDLINKLVKIQGYGDNEEYKKEVENYKNIDMLLIDDIFDVSKSIMWSKPTSEDLIITAWDNFLRGVLSSFTRVVVTSNISILEIKDKFKDNLYHLVDRNFISLTFDDNIKIEKKKQNEGKL